MNSAQKALDRFRPQTAWEAYFPNPSNPWNSAKAAHLFRRSAFGASWDRIQQAANATPDAIVDELMAGGESVRFEDEFDRLQQGVLSSGQPDQLKALWMYRLLHSPHPLKERMTLFWHDHFATSNAKINNIRLMQRQHAIFRRHALGHFGEMLQEITRDPAMILWLDANTNKKGKPNENYGREVLELFSLGVGHYTETDIKQAARALTGWDVENEQAVFRLDEHDTGPKTVLGQTGDWGAGDVIRIALGRKDCSRFLVRKLFREFISDTVEPSADLLEPLAEEFRIRNYDIAWVVRTMLSSWVFYSPAAINQRVKGPIEYLVGTVHALEGTAPPAAMARMSDQLGQSLYYPPSVKGWDGGDVWLNSTTLLRRQNLAFELTRGEGLGRRTDPAHLAEKYNLSGAERLTTFFLDLFLQNPRHGSRREIVEFLRSEQQQLAASFPSPRFVNRKLARSAAQLVLSLPDYQLG